MVVFWIIDAINVYVSCAFEHGPVLKSGILLLVTKYTVFLSGIIKLSLLLISISVDCWIIVLSFSEFEGFKTS